MKGIIKKEGALDDDMVRAWGGGYTGAAFPTLHYTRQTCNPQPSSPWMFYLKTALTFAKHSGRYVVGGKKREIGKDGMQKIANSSASKLIRITHYRVSKVMILLYLKVYIIQDSLLISNI